MATYVRPIKIGGNQNYVDEVSVGYPQLPAKELDDDFNVLYDAVNRPIAVAPAIGVSATAPTNPISGQLWWNTVKGNMYIYYDDGNSKQWVQAVPTTALVAGLFDALSSRIAALEAKNGSS